MGTYWSESSEGPLRQLRYWSTCHTRRSERAGTAQSRENLQSYPVKGQDSIGTNWKKSTFNLNINLFVFKLSVNKHWKRLLRAVAESPVLEIFKT